MIKASPGGAHTPQARLVILMEPNWAKLEIDVGAATVSEVLFGTVLTGSIPATQHVGPQQVVPFAQNETAVP